jgi:hypothetical protein
MPNRVVRIVLIPRYTALIGTTAMYTAPLLVREWSEAALVGWESTGIGNGDATLTVQLSDDLENWTDEEEMSLTAESEVTAVLEISRAWLRVKAVVTGSDPGVTCWLEGEFVEREGAGGRP